MVRKIDETMGSEKDDREKEGERDALRGRENENKGGNMKERKRKNSVN